MQMPSRKPLSQPTIGSRFRRARRSTLMVVGLDFLT